MAYVAPPFWAHGGTPTAATMNKYRDSLNALKAILDLTPKNESAPIYEGADEDEADWRFEAHINRYLIYGDEATITDPANVDNTASLPKPAAGTKGVYDLDTISWLQYGQTYEVHGCAWVIEDYEA